MVMELDLDESSLAIGRIERALSRIENALPERANRPAPQPVSSEYRRLNPNGRLPAIVDHDPIGGGAPLPIFDRGAILLLLAAKSGPFLLPDPRRHRPARA